VGTNERRWWLVAARLEVVNKRQMFPPDNQPFIVTCSWPVTVYIRIYHTSIPVYHTQSGECFKCIKRHLYEGDFWHGASVCELFQFKKKYISSRRNGRDCWEINKKCNYIHNNNIAKVTIVIKIRGVECFHYITWYFYEKMSRFWSALY
jgi:hypothetical protein